MARKLMVGGISALLVLGTLVGISYGGGGGITQPVVIELTTPGCLTNDDDPATRCHIYRLRDENGRRSGEITRIRQPVFDKDGTDVGILIGQFESGKGTGTTVTGVLNLKDGPFTDKGTVVLIGAPGVFDGAVLGGSGAYDNVRGDWVAEGVEGGFLLTLNLIP